jgi:adenylylsulfate kinase
MKITRRVKKVITWQLIAKSSTAIMLLIFYGKVGIALLYLLTDILVKGGLYYYHERCWDANNRTAKKCKH